MNVALVSVQFLLCLSASASTTESPPTIDPKYPGILVDLAESLGPALLGNGLWNAVGLVQAAMTGPEPAQSASARQSGGGTGPNSPRLSTLLSFFLDDDDLRWFTVTVWSVYSGEYSCMYRLACEHPDKGLAYSMSSARVLQSLLRIVGKVHLHQEVLEEMRSAANLSNTTDLPCYAVYSCKGPFAT